MASLKQMSFSSLNRPAAGAAGVAESVRSNPDFEELTIHGFGWFGEDEAEELAAALAHNTSLKKLEFSYCSFGRRGLRGITEALKTSTVIDRLVLCELPIGDAGAEHLADLLVSTSSLRVLSLMKCGVGQIGARVIADALKINSSLQTLNLGCNEIGDAGAAAIADALGTTTSLTRLDLDDCGIGEQGAVALGRAWGSNLALAVHALSKDFYLDAYPNSGGTWHEAVRVRALVLRTRRREQLLAFGMAMLERLGGGTDEKARSTRSSKRRSAFHGMNKDVFKLVGEAYGDY
jgi:Ran GTPase-activating protein (RanGAP) involved in mRNA processing and transport